MTYEKFLEDKLAQVFTRYIKLESLCVQHAEALELVCRKCECMDAQDVRDCMLYTDGITRLKRRKMSKFYAYKVVPGYTRDFISMCRNYEDYKVVPGHAPDTPMVKEVPKDQIWVCIACGRKSRTLCGINVKGEPVCDPGWDVHCMRSSVLCWK